MGYSVFTHTVIYDCKKLMCYGHVNINIVQCILHELAFTSLPYVLYSISLYLSLYIMTCFCFLFLLSIYNNVECFEMKNYQQTYKKHRKEWAQSTYTHTQNLMKRNFLFVYYMLGILFLHEIMISNKNKE